MKEKEDILPNHDIDKNNNYIEIKNPIYIKKTLNPYCLYQGNPINLELKTKENINTEIDTKYNDNFIKKLKFIPNDKDLVYITNSNQIFLTKFDFQEYKFNVMNVNNHNSTNYNIKEIESIILYKETNHIYDFEIFHDTNEFQSGDYVKKIFTCSKENPIRVLDANKNGKIIKNYILKNQVEEVINPVCLKINNTDLSLFSGGNKFICKINLVDDTISKFQLKNERNCFEKSVYSVFEFNDSINFYLVGTYSRKIFFVDNRTNISFDSLLYHENGLTSLKFLDNKINFISAARKDNSVYLWDIRYTKAPIHSFYRNGNTNQKLDLEVDGEENFLFLANNDGTCLVYDLKNFNNNSIIEQDSNYLCYFYENQYKEPISSLCYNKKHDLIITSNGTRHYPNKNISQNLPDCYNKDQTFDCDSLLNKSNDDEKSLEPNDIYIPSYIKFWKFE